MCTNVSISARTALKQTIYYSRCSKIEVGGLSTVRCCFVSKPLIYATSVQYCTQRSLAFKMIKMYHIAGDKSVNSSETRENNFLAVHKNHNFYPLFFNDGKQ
jgi:hypothetical protein